MMGWAGRGEAHLGGLKMLELFWRGEHRRRSYKGGVVLWGRGEFNSSNEASITCRSIPFSSYQHTLFKLRTELGTWMNTVATVIHMPLFSVCSWNSNCKTSIDQKFLDFLHMKVMRYTRLFTWKQFKKTRLFVFHFRLLLPVIKVIKKQKSL